MKRSYARRKTKAPQTEPPPTLKPEAEATQEHSEADEVQEPASDMQERLLRLQRERRDAKDAMAEYKAHQEAELKKTTRLRAARLAREAKARTPKGK
jgi:hypothetical protein